MDDAMVGRMFSICRRTFSIAQRTVRYKGNEFSAIKVDETVADKTTIWGAFPDYDCTVIVKMEKAQQITKDDSGKKVWLVGSIESERRIGEVEEMSELYIKLGLEAEYIG